MRRQRWPRGAHHHDRRSRIGEGVGLAASVAYRRVRGAAAHALYSIHTDCTHYTLYTQVLLQVLQGPICQEYTNIEFKLYSTCEWALGLGKCIMEQPVLEEEAETLASNLPGMKSHRDSNQDATLPPVCSDPGSTSSTYVLAPCNAERTICSPLSWAGASTQRRATTTDTLLKQATEAKGSKTTIRIGAQAQHTAPAAQVSQRL
jgi:hypothetical protein